MLLSLAFSSRPCLSSVLLPLRVWQVQWFFLFCMDFFLDLVSGSPTPSSVVMILMILDLGVLPPMIGSTADTDSEIGARLGLCFTFSGQANSSNLILCANNFPPNQASGDSSVYCIKLEEQTFKRFTSLTGTPIVGALLSGSFVWWRPTLFSGLSILGGAACFFVSRYLFSRKKKIQWL